MAAIFPTFIDVWLILSVDNNYYNSSSAQVNSFKIAPHFFFFLSFCDELLLWWALGWAGLDWTDVGSVYIILEFGCN